MTLKKLNDVLIDLDKISYIGKLDKHIKYGTVNTTNPFFLVVVAGHPIEIHSETKEELKRLRDDLILSFDLI